MASDPTRATAGIIGREVELAALRGFVEGLGEGPSVLVLEGDPGAGKTTLWRAGVEAARERGYHLLEARPVEAEATLAFAGVGDLLDGLLDDVLGALPPPQADALRVALLLESPRGPPPDERAVGMALLGALRAVGRDRPALVAVDDLQWLDPSSAAVLRFAWRRLRDEPAGLLLARRLEAPVEVSLIADEATRRLAVGPLSLGAIHRLLHERLGVVMARPTLHSLYEVAAGNPLFALELGRAVEREGAKPTLGEPLPLPEQLRDLVRDRIVVLPAAARSALAAAAALSQPTIEVVAAIAGGEQVLRPALEAHLIELEGRRVRFSHPLLASAAYQELDAQARRGLHRRLAELVPDEEQRALHLALGAEGPDPVVAEALDRAAAHARARGASAAASDLCEQALRLTPADEAEDVHRRTLLAARYHFSAGDMRRALTLLEAALEAAPAGPPRAEALVTLGRLHQVEGDQPQAVELFRLALAEPDLDDARRADAALGLAATLWFLREDLEVALRHAALGVELAGRIGDRVRRARALGARGILEAVLGRGEASATMDAFSELAAAESSGGAPLIGGAALVPADRPVFLLLGDGFDEAAALLPGIYRDALTRGDESSIPLILLQLALAEYLAGRWQEASRAVDEAHEVAVQTGQRYWEAFALAMRALLRASLGFEAAARSDAAATFALTGERAMAVARIHATWALGLLELSLDRPQAAVAVLTPLRERLLAAGVAEPGSIRFLADEIEALIALGRLEQAEALLGWLETRATALDRNSALAAAARCRGLLAAGHGDLDAALASFENALTEHARVPIGFERGRTLLAFGAAQRRAKGKAPARATLEQALAAFEELGAALWAQKTRAELARIGGRAPSAGELTPTERRIAELVAEGGSNKQVAAALFVTPKTVETQLSRIYRKLGIHSRAELGHRIRAEGGPDKL